MLVADYIVDYIQKQRGTAAFGYPGGMVTYLIEAFDCNKKINAFSMYHEQAAAFAACGYAQKSNNIGVAYATSGPGATNLMTGICHAYYESVPTLFITGQVNRNDAKGKMNIRQKGFQETDIINMVNSVTKYAAYVEKPEDIKYHMEKAFYFAQEGRPGPVLLDIPIDIQRADIEIETLESYVPNLVSDFDVTNQVLTILSYLKNSKKPLFLLGNGINVSGTAIKLRKLLETMNIPCVTSMIAVDLLPKDHRNNYGFIGAYGTRYSNLIISQCDTLISFGSRLDIRQTGSNVKEFAKNANLIRIDIDLLEFENKIKNNQVEIHADLDELLNSALNNKEFMDYEAPNKWINQCMYYKNTLEGIDDLLPNMIVKETSRYIPDGATVTADVGQNQVWVAQSFINKINQRILFSGGHGSMGYSLPAAIGAYYDNKKPVFCFTGDGGLQMNIQELQYLVREKLPIKIIILNNHSLGMIRHFQEMYFNSNFAHTTNKKGYSDPDFVKIGNAYGIRSYCIKNINEIEEFKDKLIDNEPLLLNIEVGDVTFVYPKLEFTKPIYDQEPLLDRELLNKLLGYQG